MKKATQLKSLVVSMAIASSSLIALAPIAAQAEVSANLGATSNYIWRGYTQSDNVPSVNGGLDYSMDSGVYVGTWAGTTGSASNGTNLEVDFYAGFADSFGSFDYDLGYIYYAYPNQQDTDFSEVYLSGGMAGATVGVNLTVSEAWDDAKTGDLYAFGSYGFDVTEDVNLSATYGVQSYAEKASKSYSHVNLAAGYKNFTFAVDKITCKGDVANVNNANDDAVFSIGYSNSFGI